MQDQPTALRDVSLTCGGPSSLELTIKGHEWPSRVKNISMSRQGIEKIHCSSAVRDKRDVLDVKML